MAKKETREAIAPYRCIQSLELFNERLFSYRQSFDDLLDYVKTTPGNNKPLQEHLIKVAEQHKAAIQEFYNY